MIANVIDFLNSNSNIIQIFLGVLSLIVSVVLAVVIHRLQRSHEKQTARENERRNKEAIAESAKVFRIDNHDEVDYLPLCVIAASTSRYSKSIRKIYTRFKKCSAELQAEILRQENIPIAVTLDCDWVSRFVENLIKDSDKYNLGKDLLYDGAKYFHRGLERYGEYKTGEIDTFIFDIPPMSKNPIPEMSQERHSFALYIDRYLEFVLKDREDSKDRPELLPQTPPYDVLWEKQRLASCEEAVMSFWTMQAVVATSIAFFRHSIVGADGAEWRQIDSGDAEIETFEDLYYQALLTLYTAYAPKENLTKEDY